MLNLIDKRMFTFEIIFKVGRVGILNTEDDIHHRIFDFYMADKGVDGHSGLFFEKCDAHIAGKTCRYSEIS